MTLSEVDWACAINEAFTTRPIFGPCLAPVVSSRKVTCTLIGSPVNMQTTDDLYSRKRESFFISQKVSLDFGICRILVS